MSWSQKEFSLSSRSKGCYLITDEVTNSIGDLISKYKIGMLNLFIKHTSAGLTLNENWDSDVRTDLSKSLDKLAPEGSMYLHDAEGPDDMPSHIKSSLVGASVLIPIRDGHLATGTWQGIWLCEFRAHRHSRKLVATINGQEY